MHLTFNPFIAAALSLSAVLAVGLPVGLAFVATRRLGGGWKWIGLGALTFFISQCVLRLPWQIPVGVLLRPKLAASNTWLYAWIAISSVTAALFEETGRYVLFRRFAKGQHTARVAVLSGVGHGGIESILLVGISLVGTLVTYVLLTHGGLSALPNTARDALETQLSSLTPGLAVLGGVERVLSLCVHVSLSLIVMQCFARGQLRWLPIAMALHTVANLSAVVASKSFGPFAAEGAVAVCAAASAVIAWRLASTMPAQPSASS